MLVHKVSYVTTADAAFPQYLFDKITKAATEFKWYFRYIEIYSLCPPGWNVDTRDIVEVGKQANDTGFWPSWEGVNGEVELSRITR